MLLWAHLSPQSKWHLDRFSYFCIAYRRLSSGMPGHILSPKKMRLCMGQSGPHLIHGCLGPTEFWSQTASQSVQPFFQRLLQNALIFYNGLPLPPWNCPFPWESGLSFNIWFFGHIRVVNPHSIWIDSTVFAGFSTVTDRPSDHARYLVCNNICSTAMQPKNYNFVFLCLVFPPVLMPQMYKRWLLHSV